jgi:hypothetical protein
MKYINMLRSAFKIHGHGGFVACWKKHKSEKVFPMKTSRPALKKKQRF